MVELFVSTLLEININIMTNPKTLTIQMGEGEFNALSKSEQVIMLHSRKISLLSQNETAQAIITLNETAIEGITEAISKLEKEIVAPKAEPKKKKKSKKK